MVSIPVPIFRPCTCMYRPDPVTYQPVPYLRDPFCPRAEHKKEAVTDHEPTYGSN